MYLLHGMNGGKRLWFLLRLRWKKPELSEYSVYLVSREFEARIDDKHGVESHRYKIEDAHGVLNYNHNTLASKVLIFAAKEIMGATFHDAWAPKERILSVAHEISLVNDKDEKVFEDWFENRMLVFWSFYKGDIEQISWHFCDLLRKQFHSIPTEEEMRKDIKDDDAEIDNEDAETDNEAAKIAKNKRRAAEQERARKKEGQSKYRP